MTFIDKDNIIACNTAEEFVRVLDPSNEYWTIGSNNWRMDWFFRGQAELPGRRLIPKAFRRDSEWPGRDMKFARERGKHRGITSSISRETYDKLINNFGIQNIDTWLVQLYAETTTMRDYLYFAKTLNFGLNWPSLDNFPTFGTKFLNDYVTKLNDQDYMSKLWGKSAFAIGQHHGLSTRLLDWTRNPLFAAFFAINDLPKDATQITVYAIHSIFPNSRFRIIEVDRSASPYIAAQDGLFTLDTLADQDFLKNGIWRSLDEAYDDDFRKITLPVSEAGELVRILWRKQVTIAHMMPVVDNILAALLNKWRWQYPNNDF